MKKLVLIYLFLLSLITIDANTISESKKLSNLFTLAGKNFNYSSPVSEDYILSLCNLEEIFARKNKDYENLFVIQHIVVNSYCLKGDIGLAVDKAHEMYEEAKNIKSDIGIALSIQAMGNTYIYSNQLHQAFSTFNEAFNIIEKSNYNFIKTRLLLQQIHTCMLMEDTDNMQLFLARVRNLLDRTEIPNKQDYTFYLQGYQTFYYIAIKDKEQAQISLEDTYQMTRKGHEFNLLYYYLCTRYYELNNEYNQALAYCDSALNISIKSRVFNLMYPFICWDMVPCYPD